MKADEYMSPEAQAARKSANEAATAQNRLKLDLMDQQQFETRLGGMRKNLENELSNNPMYSMMTFNERNAFLDSPAVRNMLEASGYMEDIMSMASGDKDAYDRLDRALNSRRRGKAFLQSTNRFTTRHWKNSMRVPVSA